MSREKDLLKNAFVLSVGKFLPKIISFVTLPILTGGLTKGEYGSYDLILTLVLLMIPVATLQIQSAAFRFLIDCRSRYEESKTVISNIFFVTLPISVLCSVVVQFFFHEYEITVRLLISFYFLLDTIYLTCGQIARGLGKNKEYSIAAIIYSAVYTIAVIVFIAIFKMGLLGVMIALSLPQIIGIVYLNIRIGIFSYVSLTAVHRTKIAELISYSWPMVPNNLSTWVLKLSDRLVITGFLGIEANAVYAVANKIPNMLALAQSITMMAWQENASLAANDKDAAQYYSKMIDRFYSIMFSCTAFLIAMCPFLFRILIRGDYSEAYFQMPVLILSVFFMVMSSSFGGIYIAHKKTANVAWSTMAAAGINLLIDLMFIKIIGIYAGSVSTLVAYMFLYYYRMMDCQRFQKVDIKHGRQSIMLMLMIAMLMICFMNNAVLNSVNFVMAGVSAWLFNREIRIKCIRMIKNTFKR